MTAIQKTDVIEMYAISKENLEEKLPTFRNLIIGYFPPNYGKLVTKDQYLLSIEKYINYNALRMEAMEYQDKTIVLVSNGDMLTNHFDYIALMSTIVPEDIEVEEVDDSISSIFNSFFNNSEEVVYGEGDREMLKAIHDHLLGDHENEPPITTDLHYVKDQDNGTYLDVYFDNKSGDPEDTVAFIGGYQISLDSLKGLVTRGEIFNGNLLKKED